MSYTSKYTGPEIDSLLDRIVVGGNGTTETSLWVGNLPSEEVCTINLSRPLSEFDELGFYIISNLPDGTKRYLYRAIPVQLIMNFIENETNASNSISMSWGYSDKDDFLDILVGTTIDSLHLSHYINDLTKVVGIKYNLESSVSSSNPIGAIIPIMGTTAPKDHLICDGSELNINEYKELANYFEKQFGTKNHFGGDGINTFAIPDLRDEFLRGYKGDNERQLSGEIGIHQDATEHKTVLTNSGKIFAYAMNISSTSDTAKNMDERINDQGGLKAHSVSATTGGAQAWTHYTSRPTNVAVLFCIKYTEGESAASESGYSETELLGSHKLFGIGGTQVYINQDIILTDDISNYDELVFRISRTNAVGQVAHVNEQVYHVKNIVYNNSDTNIWDGSIFNLNLLFGEVVSTLVWFKDQKTLRVWCTNAHFNVASNESIEFISIKGIKH